MAQLLQEESTPARIESGALARFVHSKSAVVLWCALATVGALAVMGYHPGSEDDSVYLSAIKSDLNPALYPHDAMFFRLQLRVTVFDKFMAGFVSWTGIPLAWSELIWQLLSIAAILFACWSIAAVFFEEARARWAGVALVSAMMTLPVAGTALYIADQHLHPRNVATALTLLAASRVLKGKYLQAVPLILVSVAMHPIMGALGVSFCFFLVVFETGVLKDWMTSARNSYASAVPLAWLIEQPGPSWRHAMASVNYYFLSRWTWYEWLGAVAPLLLFWLLNQFAGKRGNARLQRFSWAVFAFGAFQLFVAILISYTPALMRLTPLQPMRFLQLVYVFMTLIGGCLLGKYLLGRNLWRWAILLLVANGGMLAAQRALFSGTEHLELPGRTTTNPWLQAFAWIRDNTPKDAYFALDPHYMASSGEDYHSFRALAERSQLADAIKDSSVVVEVPELGSAWEQQVTAQSGWERFTLADFERLKREFGVNWTLVRIPQSAGLDCAWHNQVLAVCRIP